MSLELSVSDSKLSVHLSGVSGALAMKSHLELPLSEVQDAKVMPLTEAREEGKGIKVPGVRIPGVFRSGSYRTDDSWQFWYVARADDVLVIDLADDKYERIVLEVDDPQAEADKINAARQA